MASIKGENQKPEGEFRLSWMSISKGGSVKIFRNVAFPVIGILLLLWVAVAARAGHIPTVGLGTAQSFAVLAGQGITNTGSSTVRGDIGSHPNPAITGSASITITDGTMNPSYTPGAKDALVTAYNDAAGRTPVTTIATELGGQTLLHGIYNSSSGTFQITGTLTLDAQNDPNAVWIFKTASTLITGSASNVNIINSPNPAAATCRIFWQIGSSATLGTGSTMRGTLMALASITLNNSATLYGRALARDGSVTMDTNTIDASACLPAQASPSPSPSPSPGASPSPGVPPIGTSPSPGVSPALGGSPGPGSAGPIRTDGEGGATAEGTSRGAKSREPRGGPLADTGLPTAVVLTSALAFLLIGVFYNWLGISSSRFARALKGYQPKHSHGRRD